MLAVLAALPRKSAATLAEVAATVTISRSATYRVLQDLTALGVVMKTSKRDRWGLRRRYHALLQRLGAAADATAGPIDRADFSETGHQPTAGAGIPEKSGESIHGPRERTGTPGKPVYPSQSTSLSRYRLTEEGAADERAFFRDLARQEEPFLDDDPGPVWDDEAPPGDLDADDVPDDASAAEGRLGSGSQFRAAEPTPAQRRSDRLLRVDEAANLLGLTVATLYQWNYRRRIPVVKLMGRALRFRQSDLQKLIAEGVRPALGQRRRT